MAQKMGRGTPEGLGLQAAVSHHNLTPGFSSCSDAPSLQGGRRIPNPAETLCPSFLPPPPPPVPPPLITAQMGPAESRSARHHHLQHLLVPGIMAGVFPLQPCRRFNPPASLILAWLACEPHPKPPNLPAQAVEAHLAAPDTASQMAAFHTAGLQQLATLTALVRSRLSPLERKLLAALITIDVHNRDIVEMLVAHKVGWGGTRIASWSVAHNKDLCVVPHNIHTQCVCSTLMARQVSTPGDFDWQMQLRYEYDPEGDAVIVRQVNAR